MRETTFHFGPLWTREGLVFRLWAPAAAQVELVLQNETLPMTRDPRGWWRSTPHITEGGASYSFVINGATAVPDPASRRQLTDVHGPSVLVAPRRTNRAGSSWRGRPWEETVFYEVHVGTGSAGGTFQSLIGQLPALAELGITAVELMPIADFPGTRNWGYDGVLPFAPAGAYGLPEDLHRLIAAAHGNDLSIWLDVVYNHFGPEGNYLHLYAPQFFNAELDTPWGAAIDFTVPEVRHFFVENALYWILEFEFDGLRLDAVHAIHDPSPRHILDELAETVRQSVAPGRQVHLVLENDRNDVEYLSTRERDTTYTAQWNDDIHHAWHVTLTGESHGYYSTYARDAEGSLLKALATGFVRNGERSTDLSPTRFVSFVQNHDQIGNRAWGERLTTLTSPDALRCAVASMILAPQIPLLFMGEPWGSETPFQFFCDFEEELARAVREGRRREFGLDDLPDPIAEETFLASRPGTPPGQHEHEHEHEHEWLAWYRTLLSIRRDHLIPILPQISPGTAFGGGDEAAVIRWEPGWTMELNLCDRARPLPDRAFPDARAPGAPPLFEISGGDDPTGARAAHATPAAAAPAATATAVMPPWSIRVYRSDT